ncbi:hypothetical protein CBL_21451, partial [Carabus blaptoides fortunei]
MENDNCIWRKPRHKKRREGYILRKSSEVDEGVENVIIMGDLNGRMGNRNEGIEDIMGQEGEDVRNDNGERIIDICRENDSYSIVLALVDADYKYIAIDVGSYGRNSDGGIFSKSEIGKKLDNKTFNVSEPTPLIENGRPEPYVVVGDEAFPLKSYLLRPYNKRFEPDVESLLNSEAALLNPDAIRRNSTREARQVREDFKYFNSEA